LKYCFAIRDVESFLASKLPPYWIGLGKNIDFTSTKLSVPREDPGHVLKKIHQNTTKYGLTKRNCIGTKRSWDKMLLGQNALGTKCSWDKKLLGQNALGTKRSWDKTLLKKFYLTITKPYYPHKYALNSAKASAQHLCSLNFPAIWIPKIYILGSGFFQQMTWAFVCSCHKVSQQYGQVVGRVTFFCPHERKHHARLLQLLLTIITEQFSQGVYIIR
jgi:hypothetical protein